MLRVGVFAVALLYLLQLNSQGADAKHIKSALIKDNERHANEVFPGVKGDKEPTLFDLLMSALSDTEMMEEEEARRKQMEATHVQPGTKPCYWSLVSCYKKKK